jgi:hypothetical protein
MTYFKEMYYIQTGRGVRYTSIPSSALSIDRAMKNEAACFIAMNNALETKIKKLVFCDWTLNSWEEYKFYALKPFQALKQQGIDIYFWQKSNIVPLTPDWESLSKPKLADPKVIMATAIKQEKQLTQDNIFLLDDYWYERAIHPDNPDIKRKLMLRALISLVHLVKIAPNLRVLHLGRSVNFSQFIDALDPELRLWHLKEINIFEEDLSENQLAKWRTITPNLEKQDLKRDDAAKNGADQKKPSQTKKANVKIKIDADTKYYPNKHYRLNRLFYSVGDKHPAPNNYRLESFDNVWLNPEHCTQEEAFAFDNKNTELHLVDCKARRVKEDEFVRNRGGLWRCRRTNMYRHSIIYGKQTLKIDEHWRPIASLSPNEELLVYQTNPLNADIELKFSTRQPLLYKV